MKPITARKHYPTPVTPRSWHETRPGAHDRSVSHVEWATASADGLTDLSVRRTPVEMLQPVNFAIYLVGLAAVVVIAIVIGCEINAIANGYPRPMLQLWSALLGECSL